jgi:ERCC4-type nuclease
MIIKVDYREKDLISKITTILSLRTLENITVQSENLPLGDIIICSNKGDEKLILERKTLQDLASSIRDGRYKEQSFRLNECSLHNHNIVYLIEGNLQHYKPFLFGKAPIDKYAILSSFVSICYYKGFSLYKSNSIDESAEFIIQLAYKIEKEGGSSYYTDQATTSTATATATDQPTSNDNYSSTLKRTKKNNITTNNIGEIMLSQIPNVSSLVATVIMEKYKTIKNLIEALDADKTALNEMKTINKSGQSRKISKTSIENIYNYLIAEPPLEITVNE